jgi:hypothetical protein
MPLPTPKRNRPQHVVTLNPTLVTQAKALALAAGEHRLSWILDEGLKLYIAQQRKQHTSSLPTRSSTAAPWGEAAPTPPPTPSIPRVSDE